MATQSGGGAAGAAGFHKGFGEMYNAQHAQKVSASARVPYEVSRMKTKC